MWLIDANIFYSSERHRYGQGFFNQSRRRDASDGMLTFFSSLILSLLTTARLHVSQRKNSFVPDVSAHRSGQSTESILLSVCLLPPFDARRAERGREREEIKDTRLKHQYTNRFCRFSSFAFDQCERVHLHTHFLSQIHFSLHNQISSRFEKLICIFFFPLYFRMLSSKKKETINWPTNVHENESSLVDERLCS